MNPFVLLALVIGGLWFVAWVVRYYGTQERLQRIAATTRTEIARRQADYKRKYG